MSWICSTSGGVHSPEWTDGRLQNRSYLSATQSAAALWAERHGVYYPRT